MANQMQIAPERRHMLIVLDKWLQLKKVNLDYWLKNVDPSAKSWIQCKSSFLIMRCQLHANFDLILMNNKHTI